MFKILLWPGFLLLLLAQWLVPLQMIWKKEKVLTKGIAYRFKTAPVDPADPFIGKYIVLHFEEDAVRTTDIKKFTSNTKVYVRFLKDKDDFAKPASIDIVKPATTDYLETTVSYVSPEKNGGMIVLNYPFNKFYMGEYKAPAAEKIYRERNLDSSLKVFALVKIYDGDAVVKDVYVNDSLIVDVIKARNMIR